MKQIDLRRSNVILKPDRTHVLARPFRLPSVDRSVRMFTRVMAMPENAVHILVERLRAEFGGRQPGMDAFLQRRFEEMSPAFPAGKTVSQERKLLIGAYLTHEYSLEAAAL